MQKLYGYVRVSTRDQCEDRQLIALSRLSIPSGQIYIDRQSGRDFNRPARKRFPISFFYGRKGIFPRGKRRNNLVFPRAPFSVGQTAEAKKS